MGIADFYLNINLNKDENNVLETLYQTFRAEKTFRILDKEEDKCSLSIECQFDNFLPSLIIAYDNLSLYAENIASIETHGIDQTFKFINLDAFIGFMFSSNKGQLLSYYKDFGYFSIDSEKYYKKRIKLKKYYKRLKWNEVEK